MNIRSLEQVTIEIESLQNKLELLQKEKKIIKFCKKYNISQKELKKITGLNITTKNEYHSEGEYSHLHEMELTITFKRPKNENVTDWNGKKCDTEHYFKITYSSYSPDDSGDRYGTSYQYEIDESDKSDGAKHDAILGPIYKELEEHINDDEHDDIRHHIMNIHD
tara:strand:- start:376 stop:870 length:495 start_codon:yes stop_codon:yes gene_type:complete